MSRAERIKLALGALGKAGQAAALAQSSDPVATAGQNFVGIALVTDVPDQLVLGRIENRVNCDCKLNNTQACTEMPTGYRNCIYDFAANVVRDLLQLFA